MKKFAILLLVIGALAACRSSRGKGETTVDNPELKPAPAVKSITRVRFETTAGDFVVEVHPDWAPLGAQRFLTLVNEGYFDGAAFFRVVPGFVVQFGLAADPSVTARWDDTEIKDDPVIRSNTRGMVTFATAGPETRTTQVFINFADNSRLDERGFAPFGKVVAGMENVDKIRAEHGEAPDQEKISRFGNAYLGENFPNLDYIRNARIVYDPPKRLLGEPAK
jgi:cyclophilin family peptidyl-prolyl cis-trans isomerase